jgi:hypothetical protein
MQGNGPADSSAIAGFDELGRGRERLLEPQELCGIWLPGQNQLPRQENKYYM